MDRQALSAPTAADWAALRALFQGSGLLASDVPVNAAIAACLGDLVYLATPYSAHVVDEEGAFNFELSMEMALRAVPFMAAFAAGSVTALSPIVLADAMVWLDVPQIDPLDHRFWTRWCAPLLHACAVVVVPPIDGWDRSSGVFNEVQTHLMRQRRVILLAPQEAAA